MRQAIAELKLPSDGDSIPAYGDDLTLDDDDFSGTASGDDVWDLLSDEYGDDYSSDQLGQIVDGPSATNAYDQLWLTQKCAAVSRSGSGLDAGALQEQISAILASDSDGKIHMSCSTSSEVLVQTATASYIRDQLSVSKLLTQYCK